MRKFSTGYAIIVTGMVRISAEADDKFPNWR